jgi:hypothetical protein
MFVSDSGIAGERTKSRHVAAEDDGDLTLKPSPVSLSLKPHHFDPRTALAPLLGASAAPAGASLVQPFAGPRQPTG